MIEYELEIELADDLPFETWELYRGQKRGVDSFSRLIKGNKANKNDGTQKVAAILKGRIRVIENDKLMYVQDSINLKVI